MPDHLFEGKPSEHLSDEELVVFSHSKTKIAAMIEMIRLNWEKGICRYIYHWGLKF